MLVLAALIRFVGLGSQSFWLDEVVTAELMGKPFGDMLSAIPHSESTPYLYYVLLWPWAQLFGDGEAALRSLSAIFGVATVAAIWAGARELVSARAGLAAAALAALNPFLVWYSQETRAYALLALMSAVSFWCFARALGRPRWLAWWALASALALATHYFAAFTIVPEAIVLAVVAGRTRAWAVACGAVALAALALAPLAAAQQRGGGADWIGDISLAYRVAEIPKRFVGGEFGNQLRFVFWPVLLCALAALALLWTRSRAAESRGAAIALGIGGAGLVVPIAMAVATLDYVFARNLIGSLPPLLVALAAGLTAVRAPRVSNGLLALVCALSVLAVVRIATDDALQRDDWRSVAAQLDSPRAHAIVVSPAFEARTLRWYRPNLPDLVDPGVPVSEVAVVGLTRRPRRERPVARTPPGFAPVATVDHDTYRLTIFRAPREVAVDRATALGSALQPDDAFPLADRRP